MKITFNFARWIHSRKLTGTLYPFVTLLFIFYYQCLHNTTWSLDIIHYVSKCHSKSVLKAHWNLFWSKRLKNYILKYCFLVFDSWLCLIWPRSPRNATCCFDFNTIIRALITPVSVKMAQVQRKWQTVLNIWHYAISRSLLFNVYSNGPCMPNCTTACKHFVFFLTHHPLDKMAAFSQMIYSDAFSWMKNFVFWSKFHLSLFLRVQLTMLQHCFR